MPRMPKNTAIPNSLYIYCTVILSKINHPLGSNPSPSTVSLTGPTSGRKRGIPLRVGEIVSKQSGKATEILRQGSVLTN